MTALAPRLAAAAAIGQGARARATHAAPSFNTFASASAPSPPPSPLALARLFSLRPSLYPLFLVLPLPLFCPRGRQVPCCVFIIGKPKHLRSASRSAALADGRRAWRLPQSWQQPCSVVKTSRQSRLCACSLFGSIRSPSTSWVGQLLTGGLRRLSDAGPSR